MSNDQLFAYKKENPTTSGATSGSEEQREGSPNVFIPEENTYCPGPTPPDLLPYNIITTQATVYGYTYIKIVDNLKIKHLFLSVCLSVCLSLMMPHTHCTYSLFIFVCLLFCVHFTLIVLLVSLWPSNSVPYAKPMCVFWRSLGSKISMTVSS